MYIICFKPLTGQNGSSSSQISHAQASQRASASVSPRPSDGFLLNHSSLQRDSDPITVAEDNGLGQINEDLYVDVAATTLKRELYSCDCFNSTVGTTHLSNLILSRDN